MSYQDDLIAIVARARQYGITGSSNEDIARQAVTYPDPNLANSFRAGIDPSTISRLYSVPANAPSSQTPQQLDARRAQDIANNPVGRGIGGAASAYGNLINPGGAGARPTSSSSADYVPGQGPGSTGIGMTATNEDIKSPSSSTDTTAPPRNPARDLIMAVQSPKDLGPYWTLRLAELQDRYDTVAADPNHDPNELKNIAAEINTASDNIAAAYKPAPRGTGGSGDPYAGAKFQLEQEKFNYQKEQDAAALKVNEAGLTGTYNGQPTMAATNRAEDVAYRNDQAQKAEQARNEQMQADFLKLILSGKGYAPQGSPYLSGAEPGGPLEALSAQSGVPFTPIQAPQAPGSAQIAQMAPAALRNGGLATALMGMGG